MQIRRISPSALFLLIAMASAPVLRAQSAVAVEVDEVMDNRLSEGMQTGSLDIQVNLKGGSVDKARAARIVVKEARDDKGTNLTPEKTPDFQDRDYNNGRLAVSLKNPPRTARAVHLKGNVELFVPSRDPNSVVRVERALTKLDAPLSSAKLKAARIAITPLSSAGYTAQMKKQKLTDKDIEELKAKGKAAGASDKEIELAIGFAKALDEIGGQPLPEGSVVLSLSSKDMERIQHIDILGADGKPVDVGSRESTSRGDATLVVLHPNSPPPPGAALEFTLLTDAARVSTPFDLKKVDLP